jgi:hypothetical protein
VACGFHYAGAEPAAPGSAGDGTRAFGRASSQNAAVTCAPSRRSPPHHGLLRPERGALTDPVRWGCLFMRYTGNSVTLCYGQCTHNGVFAQPSGRQTGPELRIRIRLDLVSSNAKATWVSRWLTPTRRPLVGSPCLSRQRSAVAIILAPYGAQGHARMGSLRRVIRPS